MSIIAALTIVSCKNQNRTSQASREELEELKQELTDSVLNAIDELESSYEALSNNTVSIPTLTLSEEEMRIKPKYLLEPSIVNDLVTTYQKLNALAIFVVELNVRKAYGMPVEEVKGVIAKLAMELNHPIGLDLLTSESTMSEKISAEYSKCKENGELIYFWKFQGAILAEINFLFAQDPDIYFSRLTDQGWQSQIQMNMYVVDAMKELAPYDPEIASALSQAVQNRTLTDDGMNGLVGSSVDDARTYYLANRDYLIARRNSLIQ